MLTKRLSRRDFLKSSVLAAAGVAVASCGPSATPTMAPEATTAPITAPEPTAIPTTAPEPTAAPTTAEEPTTAPAASGATYDEWVKVVASTDPLELRFVTWDDTTQAGPVQDYYKYLEGEWKKRYPNGTIHWEQVGWGEIYPKVSGFLLAKDAVDIAYWCAFTTQNWCTMKAYWPLDDLMPKWWFDTRVPQVLSPDSPGNCNGKIILVTPTLETEFHLVRKDVMEAAGVKPEDMYTFDGVLNSLKAMAKQPGFEKPYGLKIGADWSAVPSLGFYWMGNGLGFFGDFRADGSEKDAWIESATFVKRLFEYAPEASLNWTYSECEQAFATGQIACHEHGNWWYDILSQYDPSHEKNNDKTTTIVPWPYGPSSPEKAPFWSLNLTGWGLFANSPAEHHQAAADLLAILSDKRAVYKQTSQCSTPASTDWTVEERLEVSANPDIVWWWTLCDDLYKNQRSIGMKSYPASDEVWFKAQPMLVAMYRNELTPEQFYAQMREFALPLYEKAGYMG